MIIMNSILIIAKKEWKDILRSKLFIEIAVILSFLTITSLTVSFLLFSAQLREYNDALKILKEMGKNPAAPFPELYPLNLLQGVVDYIEIIGAVLGMVLGYISISKERNSKSLKLIFTRPIKKINIIFGKIAGNLLFILSLMSIICIIIYLTILIIGGVNLSVLEIFKLLFFDIFSSLYILLFFLLAFYFSLNQKKLSHALIISFITWLFIVLVIPQIGDTMDPDNQVPGGFFKSMNLSQIQQKHVENKIKKYELKREFIEQLSITKHYERLSFATLGINRLFNDKRLSVIFSKTYIDLIWIIIFTIAGFIANCNLMMMETDYLKDDQ